MTTRRDFLEKSLFAAAAAVLAGETHETRAEDTAKASTSANEKIRLACIGVNGRGSEHLLEFGRLHDCEIVAIVDVDEDVGKSRVERLKKRTGKEPAYYRDLRKMLEDKRIDAVSIATPNHWHSLAAIWALQAGKDVYVEKPVSHNVSEGRRLVQTARKHERICQAGMQCRTNPGMRELMMYVQHGGVGEVKLARGLCYKRRGSIGPKGNYPIPKSIDYDLWSGPAQIKPLTRRSLHYDWHWIWDYGNGDLGNQGIHQMDLARWGLGVNDIGTSVLSYGGRLGYEDAGESANTQVSIHEYPNGKRLVFEVRGLKTAPLRGATVGVIFYGTDGYVVVPSYTGGVAFDLKHQPVKKFGGGKSHFANFLAAVRSRKTSDLNADVLEGHISSALCHLGNISYRLGEPIDGKDAAERLGADKEAWETFDRFEEHLWYNDVAIKDSPLVRFGKKLAINPTSETFVGNSSSEANAFLTRDYRKPFVVPSESELAYTQGHSEACHVGSTV
ncbi:MAG TPA: Gfo/Idh/MocA family oxidoreductase [Planctomycetaceae bacterium]|nr:Gfo/Idh/MocA family oxidoreductase [Planctomycetaceae bacterium]